MAFVLSLGTIASAQTAVKPHKTPQQKAELLSNKLQKKLDLNADQTNKIHTILLSQATKVDSIKQAQNTADKKGNRKALRAIMESTDSQISSVLNADQQKKYTALKAAKLEKIRAKKAEGDKKTQG